MANNHDPESEFSEEEEEDRSSEDVDSEPENNLEQTQFSKIPISFEPPKLPRPPPSSSEDNDSSSDADSEPDAGPKSLNLTDVSQKSIAAEARNPRSKPSDSEPITPAKRPVEEKQLDSKDGKRSKLELQKKTDVSDSSSKKVLFQRLWSEADEIVILVGMLNYAEMKKANPIANMDAFLDFIKESLHVEVSKHQLRDKITKLRRKYENNKIKNKTTFAKPHEQEVFELSMKIWGNDKGKEIVLAIPLVNGNVKSSNPKVNSSAVRNSPLKKTNVVKSNNSENVADVAVEKMELGKRGSSYGVNVTERVLRIGADLFEGENEVRGTKEWKKLLIDEMELHVKELDIQRARAKLVLDNLKSVNQ